MAAPMNNSNNNNKSTTTTTIIEEDDWNLPLDFNLFAQYETHVIRVNNHTNDNSFQIQCVESLTPIDMMALSNGNHDATGFCVWTGAFLFLRALQQQQQRNHWNDYFVNQRVLELGCGTGISGLTLLHTPAALPTELILTDADPNALELCRRNLQANHHAASRITINNNSASSKETTRVRVEQLLWGDDLSSFSIRPHSIDTILACDILYDIASLPKIYQTCRNALSKTNGIFVLVHVPRACYREDFPPPLGGLDAYIVEQARVVADLILVETIQPKHLLQTTNNDFEISETLPVDSLQEMQDIGASIFVFSRNHSK